MPIPADEQLAYRQGADAFRAGLPLRANPKGSSRAAKSWHKGWLRARDDSLDDRSSNKEN